MSFYRGSANSGCRGRSGRGREGGSGRGSGRGRGGTNGSFKTHYAGPPESLVLLGHFGWVMQDDIVCNIDIGDVPYVNAPIFLENKEQIGKVDEIFGHRKKFHVSIILAEKLKAESFKEGTQFYIDPANLLPAKKFILEARGENFSGSRGARGGRHGGRCNRTVGVGDVNKGSGFGKRGRR